MTKSLKKAMTSLKIQIKKIKMVFAPSNQTKFDKQFR